MNSSERKPYERLTAYKSFIKEILNGTYHKMEGWDPNFIQSPLGKNLSRVNLIATVIALNKGAEDKVVGMNIDDGSAQIALRVFDNIEIFSGLGIGNIVQIIGKPREYNGERYIVPEIIRPIDSNWLLVRKMEFEAEYGQNYLDIGPAAPQVTNTAKEDDKNAYDGVLEFLQKNDKGDGVDIEKVVSSLSIKDSERIVDDLLKQGEIFEIRPGRVKVL